MTPEPNSAPEAPQIDPTSKPTDKQTDSVVNTPPPAAAQPTTQPPQSQQQRQDNADQLAASDNKTALPAGDAPDTPPPLDEPEPAPAWLMRRPIEAMVYIISRAGDNGRMRPFRRLTHITKHMYLGGQVDLRGWRTLESWGVRAMLNMRIEWDDRKFGIQPDYYLWLPTIDGTPPTVEQLAKGSAFIHDQVANNRAVYIHCAAGLGRSPTQVIAYLMTCGMTSQQAVDFVEVRRPFIVLSQSQLRRLNEFTAYIAAHQIRYHDADAFLPAPQPMNVNP